MRDDFSALCGITEQELLTQLKPDIEQMAKVNGETYEERLAYPNGEVRKGDIESCLERTRSLFASIPNDLENKTEKHYQTIFYLLFRLMGQYVDTEVKSAIGAWKIEKG